MKKYNDDARFIFESLTKDMNKEQKENTDVRIFGELFGGFYPGLETVGDCIRVQKGIYYAPYNEFILFDIKIGEKFLNFQE